MAQVKISSRKGFGGLVKQVASHRGFTLTLLILVVLIGVSMRVPAFIGKDNIIAVILSMSINGVVVIGMTLALISGGFDLSVGWVMALSGAVAAKLYLAGGGIWVASAAGLLVAMGCGLINGVLITKARLSPFITTLAMMGIARGVCMVITMGSPISLSKSVPASFKEIGNGTLNLGAVGVPWLILIFIVFAVAGHFLLTYSKPFRKVFYVGSNEKAAIYSGLNAHRIKIAVYTLSATLAGFAGILILTRFNSASPNTGTGLEITAVSAAVIGGASLNGGEGSISGSVLGMLLLSIVSSALTALRVNVYWQELINGLILLLAVLFDAFMEKRRQAQETKS